MQNISEQNQTEKTPSVLGGAMIVAGTLVGAGMFSLPVASSGMWLMWSTFILLFSWFFMYHSSLMILETNLNYPVGSSFDTFVKDTLGTTWNTINGLGVAFVLYVLLYAYISGGGSVVNYTLNAIFSTAPPLKVSGFVFVVVFSLIVTISIHWVSRLATVLMGGMIVSFAILISDLSLNVEPRILFDLDAKGASYLPYVFAALPFYLISFGFHSNVPALVRYYNKNHSKIIKSMGYGSLLALLVYLLWLISTFGNISREGFKEVIAEGGNIGALLNAVDHENNDNSRSFIVSVFANMAIVSSYLGVSLGLFDFIADKFKFDSSLSGKTKTALVTFLPAAIGGLLLPNGFHYAISYAGLAAALWGAIIPALMAKKNRKKHENQVYTVWGGNGLIYAVMVFGIVNAACHILAMMDLLPVYR